jgi:fatty-acyl-CoA synthase
MAAQHEVESCLFSHPLVLEAAVVARPDEKWGETPMAFVVLKAGVVWEAPLEAELIAYCRAHLAHFKCPKHAVHLAEGLPKTSTGKVQKFELRLLAKAAAAQV